MASRQNLLCRGNVLLSICLFVCWGLWGNGKYISEVFRLLCSATVLVGSLSFSKQNVCCKHGGGTVLILRKSGV